MRGTANTLPTCGEPPNAEERWRSVIQNWPVTGARSSRTKGRSRRRRYGPVTGSRQQFVRAVPMTRLHPARPTAAQHTVTHTGPTVIIRTRRVESRRSRRQPARTSKVSTTGATAASDGWGGTPPGPARSGRAGPSPAAEMTAALRKVGPAQPAHRRDRTRCTSSPQRSFPSGLQWRQHGHAAHEASHETTVSGGTNAVAG